MIVQQVLDLNLNLNPSCTINVRGMNKAPPSLCISLFSGMATLLCFYNFFTSIPLLAYCSTPNLEDQWGWVFLSGPYHLTCPAWVAL